MKRILTLALLALLVAQGMLAQALFTQDKAVRVGTLPNGLTYYVRHNAEPKQRAYFYIAQKVGAIQENADQRGLAHFLEHMAFNGTTHFPGESLRTYLERIGVKFGADLNAYTATEETVYNIDNVPTTVAGALDSCLLILHDWSHDLLLTDKDIDEERGVIQEEWRSRNSADQRMHEAMMPVIMAGSKYVDAMPIGSMDIVMHFKPETLRKYYQRWYRPDLQGIVVVGDIDVDQMVAKIKKTFADIPVPRKDAPERVYYPVPDNQEPIFFIGTDKEITSPSVTIYYKHDATPRTEKNRREYMVNNLFASMIYGMFHDHTRDIAQKPNAPFGLCFARDNTYFLANTKRALQFIVDCHSANGDIERGMKAGLRELFRVRQHGFTQTEFDRYIKDIEAGLDQQLRNKDKRQSGGFVNEYVRNFLDGEPIPSLEDEVAFWKATLPTLTVDDLNQWFNSLFRADDSNIVFALTAPKNDTLAIPTKDDLWRWYKEVESEKLDPYVDQVNTLPFLPKEPVAGKIVSEKKDQKGRTLMTLSNGAKVVIMPTTYKKDQILLQALGHGGASLFSAEDYKYRQLMSMATAVSGWGNWNLADMEKGFTGVNVSLQSGVADHYQSVAASCAQKDLRPMFEQVYAAFLYPHKDTDAFQALCQRLERSTRESEQLPMKAYGDSLDMTFYGNNPYAENLKADDYKNVDYDHLLDLYRRSFNDAGKFTFTIIGSVNIDSLRSLIEKYVASLPTTGENLTSRPVLDYKPGSRTCRFTHEQETPKSTIRIEYLAPCPFTLKNQLIASLLGQVLTIKYTQTIREDAGAAYSVGAGAEVTYYPAERARLVISFPTNPKQRALATDLVGKGIDEMVKNGPDAADLQKARDYLLKLHQSNSQVNEYWQYVLSYEWNHGMDYDEPYDATLKSITAKDLQHMARLLRDGQRLECTMSSPIK